MTCVTLPARPNLVGRAKLLEEIAARLGGGARVVTLWGPGGIGKTSLAVATLHDFRATAPTRASADPFDDVVFVPLAAATNAADAIRSVAQALGVSAPGSRNIDESTARIGLALSARGAVLVLIDNVEQVVAEVARAMVEWLARAPRARFIVTSREPLAIAGEHVIPVTPLRVPDANGADVDAAVRDSEAAELLLARARAARPDFVAPAEVVRRLSCLTEGIPLAIELCAAHLDVLGAEALVDKLAHGGLSLERLSNPRRDVDDRHRTLASAIDVSLRMLSPHELQVLGALALFRGSFDVEAVMAVAADGVSLDATECLAHFRALVRKSLVRDAGVVGGTPRFALFESVRTATLRGHAPDAATVVRHGEWAGAAGRAAMERSRGRGGAQALAELVAIQDDLAATIERYRDTGEGESHAMSACHALLELSLVRGPIGPFVDLVGTLVRARPGEPSIGEAELALASALFVTGQFDEARAIAHAAQRHLDRGPKGAQAKIASLLGDLAMRQGEYDGAQAHHQEAIRLAEQSADLGVLGWCEQALGAAFYFVARYEEAGVWFTRALQHLRASGYRRAEARTLSRFGFLAYDEGRTKEARVDFERSLAIFEELGDERLAGYARGYIGNVLRAEGQLDLATTFYEQALDAMRRTGDRSFESVFAMDSGVAKLLAGDVASGRRLLHDAHDIVLEARDRYVEGLILGYRVVAEALAGDDQRAAALLSESQLRTSGLARDALPIHEKHLELVLAARAGDHARLASIAAWLKETSNARATNEHVRLARRLMTDTLAKVRPDDEVMVVDPAGRVRPPHGTWLSLSAHPSLVKIVLALAARRLESPGAPLSTPEVLRAGWPSEKVTAKAGALRVRVAIAQLRKQGLREVLQHEPGGYFFDPRVPLLLRQSAEGDVGATAGHK